MRAVLLLTSSQPVLHQKDTKQLLLVPPFFKASCSHRTEATGSARPECSHKQDNRALHGHAALTTPSCSPAQEIPP